MVHRLPPPRWADHPNPRALNFDSQYDAYRGVICYLRVFSGTFSLNQSLVLMSDQRKTQVKELGTFVPAHYPKKP